MLEVPFHAFGEFTNPAQMADDSLFQVSLATHRSPLGSTVDTVIHEQLTPKVDDKIHRFRASMNMTEARL